MQSPAAEEPHVEIPGLDHNTNDYHKGSMDDLHHITKRNALITGGATPEDVAHIVFHLASDESSHIKGTYTPGCGGTYLP